MVRLVELVIVMVCILTPQFVMAVELDGDEFSKAITGTALAGVVLGAYKVWRDGLPLTTKTPNA